jgi:phosphoglycolate phosphatase
MLDAAMLDAVFFDLDGTLADTAPDLGAALNHLRKEEGLAALPAEKMRAHVSAGSRGLLGVGFGLVPADAAYPELQRRFLDYYERHLCVATTLFAGMTELLDALDELGIGWGIVTNKPDRYTVPLVDQLGLGQRAVAVVSGDTTAHAKPHPEPLLHACRLARAEPTKCFYVGDDLRDVQAGRAAGMRTVIAAYGYLGEGPPLAEWQADATIGHPSELLGLVGIG